MNLPPPRLSRPPRPIRRRPTTLATASAVAVIATKSVPPDPVVTPGPAPATDTTHLIGVRRYGFHAMPTTAVLSFDKALEPPRPPAREFQVAGQKGGRISIRSAVYDPTAHTVTLHFSKRLSIHHPYKLIISGTGWRGGR